MRDASSLLHGFPEYRSAANYRSFAKLNEFLAFNLPELQLADSS